MPVKASQEEGLDSSGASVGGLLQLFTDWTKPLPLSRITSDRRTFILAVACGIAAVLLGIGFLVPGTLFRAFLPFLCGFFIAILLMITTVVSPSIFHALL